MLDEMMKALGPNPILQSVLGFMALMAGVYSIYKGISSSKKEIGVSVEDKRAEWEAYRQLENIEQNSFKMVELLSKIVDGQKVLADKIGGLSSALWNRRQYDDQTKG